jgi:hypothetical protein
MKTVRVYYAGIPVKNKNAEKRQVLEDFHSGVPNGQSTAVETQNWEPSNLAVIQGWAAEDCKSSSHLLFRRHVIEQQRRTGGHTLAIDSNLFLYRDPGNTHNYLRFSLDGIFPTTGNYFTDYVDPARWQKISRDLGISLKPWTDNGRFILIALQRNGGWSMGETGVVKWCEDTVREIRKYTSRPIIVRAHPGDHRAREYLKKLNVDVKISNNQALTDDFKKCWAVVTYNSSPGVAAAIEGIPVFVTDPVPCKSQAYAVCNTDLSKIESPMRPDRQEWIEKVAMSHYNFDDLKSGVAWQYISRYV